MKNRTPQNFVLGSVLFLIYIKDICKTNFQGRIKYFADDIALCYVKDSREQVKNQFNPIPLLCRLSFLKIKLYLVQK